MGAGYWIKRYLLAAVPLFAILAGVEFATGTPTRADILSVAAWAAVAAGVFIGSQYWRYKKNISCSACDAVDKRP
jgi:hypothetical protein